MPGLCCPWMRFRSSFIFFLSFNFIAGSCAFVRTPMTAIAQPVLRTIIAAGPPPTFSLGEVRTASQSVKRCAGFADWTADAAASNSGFLIPRPLRSFDTLANVDDVQQCVEQAASRTDAQEGLLLCARIPFDDPEESRALSHQNEVAMQSLETMLIDHLQQPELVQIIMDDMKSLCMVMKGFAAGQCNGLEIKFEMIGANSCRRWHHDHFFGRSIVTYSGMHGTTFCDDPATSLEEIMKSDASASVQTAEVGDILFIKGAKFHTTGDGW